MTLRDFLQRFLQPGIDRLALLRRVLVVRIWKLWKDRDDAAGSLDFKFLPTFETRRPQRGTGHNKRCLIIVLDREGHDNNPAADTAKITFTIAGVPRAEEHRITASVYRRSVS